MIHGEGPKAFGRVAAPPSGDTLAAMDRGRSEPSAAALVAVLVFGVVLAVALLAVLVRAPGSGAKLDLVGVTPIGCPEGSHAPVCYRADATNVGKAPGYLRCVVAGAEGSTALFDTGGPEYNAPTEVVPLQTIPLTITVEPKNGTAVGVPQISCRFAEGPPVVDSSL